MRHDLLRLGRAAGLLFILLLSPRLEGAAASTAEDDAAWARFTTENSDLPHERVTALLVARDGALWIGTGRGAARLARGRWEVFTRADSRLPDDEITALAQTRDGAIWIGTAGGGLARAGPDGFQTLDSGNSGLPSNNIGAIAGARDGSLWVGAGETIARLHEGRWETFPARVTGLGSEVLAFAFAPDGHLWAGAGMGPGAWGALKAVARRQDRRRGGGLIEWSGGRWTLFTAETSPLPHDNVQALLGTADGALWVGTFGGLARWAKGNWQVLTTENSPLASDHVGALAQTADGALWVGTGLIRPGVSRFHRGRWRTFTSSDGGIPPHDVLALAAAPDGGLWIGTDGGGLARFRERLEVFHPGNSPLPDDDVRSLAVGRDGSVWVGTLGRGLARFDGETWELFSRAQGCLPEDSVMAVLPTTDGAVWVGTGGGGVVRLSEGHCQIFDPANSGLPGKNIHDLRQGTDGTVWAYATDGGFARFREGRWEVVAGRAPGVVPDEALGAFSLPAPDGARWEYDGRTLVRVRDGQEERFTPGRGGLPDGRLEDRLVAPDGSFWMATEDGTLARFDGSRWQVFTAENAGLPRARPLALAVARDGGAWIGTLGSGLVRFRPPEARPEIVELIGAQHEVTQSRHTFAAVTFDAGYRTRPEEFRYVWARTRTGTAAALTGSDRLETRTRSPVQTFAFDASGRYMVEVSAIDRYGYASPVTRHEFEVRLPRAGATPLLERGLVFGTLTALLYSVALVPLVLLYPRSSHVRTAVNSGLFSKLPLLHKTILNSRWARRHLFRAFVTKTSTRYRGELPEHYVPQSIQPGADDAASPLDVNAADPHAALGEIAPRLFGAEKRAQILGRSGTGKSVLLRALAVIAARDFLDGHERLPVFLDLRTSFLAGAQIEDLVRGAIRGGGVELPDDVLDFVITKGGLLLLLDSANEVPEDALRDTLNRFLHHDANNSVLLASQQDLLRRADVATLYLKSFTPELARGYLERVLGRDVWERLPAGAQRLASNPKDLEVLAHVLQAAEPEDVPIRRASLYRTLLEEDAAVRAWVAVDDAKIRALYGIAFRMVAEVRRALDESQLAEWARAELDALGVGKERQADETRAILAAVRRSRMFAVEPPRPPLGRGAEMLAFQHELMGRFLAGRHLRRLASGPLPRLLELSAQAPLLDVFFFAIDELSSPTILNGLLTGLLEAGGEQRLRIVAYALDTSPGSVDEEVRKRYQRARIDADLRDTPAR